LGDLLAAELPRTRQFRFVGIELLRQSHERSDTRAGLQAPVDVADRRGDLGADFRELAQFAERSEGKTVTFGKAATDLGIDVDQRCDKVATLITEHHNVAY